MQYGLIISRNYVIKNPYVLTQGLLSKERVTTELIVSNLHSMVTKSLLDQSICYAPSTMACGISFDVCRFVYG